jgi:hypothetical protein
MSDEQEDIGDVDAGLDDQIEDRDEWGTYDEGADFAICAFCGDEDGAGVMENVTGFGAVCLHCAIEEGWLDRETLEYTDAFDMQMIPDDDLRDNF